MKLQRALGLSFAASLSLAACPKSLPPPAATTLFFVRHAEKAAADHENPELSAAGKERAAALVPALADEKLDAVYVTEFIRTQQTAAPLLAARGKSAIQRPAEPIAPWVDLLTTLPQGQRVLVVGHSHTLPGIILGLGIPGPFEINSGDYGDIFVVSRDPQGQTTLTKRRFGK